MSHNRIATLGELRNELTAPAGPHPSHGLAVRAAALVSDRPFGPLVYKIAAGRARQAALLWTRIADQLDGQACVNALSVAAAEAHQGADPSAAADAIARLRITASRDHAEIPAIVDELAHDRAVSAALNPTRSERHSPMITSTNHADTVYASWPTTDPWAGDDHDPLSTIHQPASSPADTVSVGLALACARDDIHAAGCAEADQRRDYALSARDNAVTVLLNPASTPRERACAEHCLIEAETIIAGTSEALPPP